MTLRRIACAAISMLPCVLAAQQPAVTPAATPAVTPTEILQRIATAVMPEVGFREVRTIRVLKAPVISTGRLRYAPGGRLERETRTPVAERVVIDGMQVTIERSGTVSQFGLVAGSPQAALVNALRAILGGRPSDLDALYRATVDGSEARWTLQLNPRTDDGAVRVINLSGSGGLVGEIEVVERNGDKTVTTLLR